MFFLKPEVKVIKESDNRSTRVLANPIAIPSYPAYMVTILHFLPTHLIHLRWK
jgi:hypothetical protein